MTDISDQYFELNGSLIKKTEMKAVSSVAKTANGFGFYINYFDKNHLVYENKSKETVEMQRTKWIKNFLGKE